MRLKAFVAGDVGVWLVTREDCVSSLVLLGFVTGRLFLF